MSEKNDGAAPLVDGFTEVTKDEFFACIGPMDVRPHSQFEDRTIWETPSRVRAGVTFPGWKYPGRERHYFLPEAALSSSRKQGG